MQTETQVMVKSEEGQESEDRHLTAVKMAAMWGHSFSRHSATLPSISTYEIWLHFGNTGNLSSTRGLVQIQRTLVFFWGEVICLRQHFGPEERHSYYAFERKQNGCGVFESQTLREGACVAPGTDNWKALGVLYCLSKEEAFSFLPELEWVEAHFTAHERIELWRAYQEHLEVYSPR